MKKIIVLMITVLASKFAFANSPLWTCDLTFLAEGSGAQILVGNYEVEGEGDLNCIGLKGEKENLPILVKMTAAPIDLRVAIGSMKVFGKSEKISLFSYAPQDLIGEYSMLQTNVSAGVGMGVFLGKKLNLMDLSFPISLKLLKGLGLDVGLSGMTIEVDRSRM